MSTTPKPVVWSPGSMPRMRISGSYVEVPAHGVEEHRRGKAQRVHAVQQAVGAGHTNATPAPVGDAAVPLERLHHEMTHGARDAGDERHRKRLPELEWRDEGKQCTGHAGDRHAERPTGPVEAA